MQVKEIFYLGIFFTRQLQKSGFPFKKFAFSSDELKKRFFFEQKFLCLSAPVVCVIDYVFTTMPSIALRKRKPP